MIAEGDSLYLMIRDMPADERPREKLLAHGPSVLSNAELLAIILNTGVKGVNVVTIATRILRDLDGLPGLARAGIDDLCRMHGLGTAKATKLMAALELGRRTAVAQPEERPRIKAPEDIYAIAGSDMGTLAQEQLRVVSLDTRNRVLRVTTLYQGSVNSAQVRIAEVFRQAVGLNATAIALLHNHPSGDPSPSSPDIKLTTDLVAAGALLNIKVLDHLIVGGTQFRSLRRMGLGFPKGDGKPGRG